MAMSLAGKRALITGSTSGIGLAMARALHADGAEVILNGFGDEAEIEKMCKALGGAAHFYRCFECKDGKFRSSGSQPALHCIRSQHSLVQQKKSVG